MVKFSWKSTPPDAAHGGRTDKEDLAVLRADGLTASIKSHPDGQIEYRISGNTEAVSKWKRLISG